jgi:drug/metabolite transporter (DMT)-like permease
MNIRLRADLALVFIAFIWGATFVVIKEALADVSSLLFLTLRFTLAAVLLAVYFRRGWLPDRSHLWAGFLVGSCLGIGYAFQTIGLETTTPANAGFLTGFYIPVVPLLGAILHRRAPAWSEAIGVVLATVGIVLLTLPGEGLQFRRGDLLVLAGAISFAGHIMTMGHFSVTVPYRILSFTQIAVSALYGCGTFWWAETPRIQWTWAVFFALITTAVFATAVALAVQSWAQQHTTPTRTALIFSMEPVFAWVTSYLVSGEVLSMRATLGAFAVLAGILVVELRGGGAPKEA